jgi:hypothetical protein
MAAAQKSMKTELEIEVAHVGLPALGPARWDELAGTARTGKVGGCQGHPTSALMTCVHNPRENAN